MYNMFKTNQINSENIYRVVDSIIARRMYIDMYIRYRIVYSIYYDTARVRCVKCLTQINQPAQFI